MSQLPFGWVCFSNVFERFGLYGEPRPSQLPFGWVCFSNAQKVGEERGQQSRLNCLSAGSVSLTRSDWCGSTLSHFRLNCLSAGSVSLTTRRRTNLGRRDMSQLPFGWVCFSNLPWTSTSVIDSQGLNCLSAGSVSLTGDISLSHFSGTTSQLPFGWVCFSNCHCVSGCLARAKWRERSGVGGGRGEMAVGFVAAKARR